jgi:hypothetical protein
MTEHVFTKYDARQYSISETIILSQIILSNSCVIMRRVSNDFAP